MACGSQAKVPFIAFDIAFWSSDASGSIQRHHKLIARSCG